MRISDWSSDVCSSDLGQTEDALGHDVALDLRGAPGDGAGEASQVAVEAALAVAVELEVAQRRAGRVVERRRTEPLHRLLARSLDRLGPHHLEDRLLGRHHPRSEEHTSELQSLMRIT